MKRRIPWLIVGVLAGTLWGGCICSPHGYYHNHEEYLFHQMGYFCGIWIGLIAGIVLDVWATISRRKKSMRPYSDINGPSKNIKKHAID
jgi:hypothetical protein